MPLVGLCRPALLCLTLISAVDSQGAEPASAAAVMVQACYGCHARPGSRAQGLVPFQQTSAAKLADKLRAYKNGDLQGTVMNRISLGYTDAELSDIASVIAQTLPNEALPAAPE
ncbi:MAG: c-type cytochrome [bacterium]